jgi:hypothetical protein
MDNTTNEPFGIEGLTVGDRAVFTSRFSDVRDAMFANPYQTIWGALGEPPFARFPVTLGSVLRGLLSFGSSWVFLDAAKRAVASNADLRWGPDRQGYRRLLHPNGIGLTGMWEITEETPYSGYFRKGSRGLLIARYSTCCTETRRGYTRSLALAGRVYPTTDPRHPTPLPTACFITQQDIGGDDSRSINEAVLRNAPNTTATRRGSGLPILLTTGIVFMFADKQPSARQVYQIAELGKASGEPTRAPEFMQFTVVPEQPVIPGEALDFRDEVMAQIYDRGDTTPKRTLTFRIETSDQGVTRGLALKQRREIAGWRQIGTITFDSAVASFNADRVVHFNHPPWRDDRNDPATTRVR